MNFRYMLYFNFSGKGLGIGSPSHSLHFFSRKMLLIIRTDQISLPDQISSLLEIFGNVFIAIFIPHIVTS